jgi:hypothetical protein
LPIVITVKTDGKILVPVYPLDKERLATVSPGREYRIKLTIPRSSRRHRFYFAAIRAAAHHWPENIDPCPDGDEELLRAWLQCKSGHHEPTIDFPLEATQSVSQLIERIRGDGKYAFIKPVETKDGPQLRVFIPLSIAHDKMDEQEFDPIARGAIHWIEAIVGVPVDKLVAEHDHSITRESV